MQFIYVKGEIYDKLLQVYSLKNQLFMDCGEIFQCWIIFSSKSSVLCGAYPSKDMPKRLDWEIVFLPKTSTPAYCKKPQITTKRCL
jgi:hypothetical protein